eukprot:gene15221-17427_t
MNDAVKNSKFSEFYCLLLKSVTQARGPDSGLNWRWLDLNLLLNELNLHAFGSVDWYFDVDKSSSDRKKNLSHIAEVYEALSETAKLNVLQKSAIEHVDALFAGTNNDKAMKAEERGDDKTAIKEYEAALALDPHCLAAMYNYAEFLFRRERYAKAEQLLKTFLLLCPKHAIAWGLRAMVAESVGSIGTAIECYEHAYLIDKTSVTRLRNYAMLMVEMKTFDRAKSLYEELLEMDPTNGVVIGEYADLLHSMNLKTEAAAAFERAFSTGNCNSTVVNDYAVLLRTMAQENNDPSLLVRAREIFQLIPQPNAYERMNQRYF